MKLLVQENAEENMRNFIISFMVTYTGDSMELTNKQETIIKIVCILILIALNIAVYLNGRDLSCDKCQIRFNSESLAQVQEFSINITTLYNNYLENDCYIEYSEYGFIIKNVIK
jgi:hypothetical protein